MSKSQIPVKIDNGVVYYEKFPPWIRKKYYDTIKGVCQICKKNISLDKMDIHRIKRNYEGGLYTLCPLDHQEQNCKFICKTCHKLLHSNEQKCNSNY